MGIFVPGLVVHQSVYGFDVMAVTLALGSALVLAVALHLAQVWGAVVLLGTADCLLIYVLLRPQSGVLLATVPVNVDAIAFWMVWDAQKAVLEVEAFMHAVVFSAQTRGMTATTRWTRGPATRPS